MTEFTFAHGRFHMVSAYRMMLVGLLAPCAFAACKPSATSFANGQDANSSLAALNAALPTLAPSDPWVLKGATACTKYLTPDIITAVFGSAAGQSEMTNPHSCTFSTAHQPNTDYSTINVLLMSGGRAVFDGDVDTQNGTPLSGVGDKAVRTDEDGVQAVKGDHICTVYVKPPYGTKLKGDALALKLGEVCNKLFSLP